MTPRSRKYFRRRKYNKTHGLAPFKGVDINTGEEVYYFTVDNYDSIIGSGIAPIY